MRFYFILFFLKHICLAILKKIAASLSQSFPNMKQATHHINGFATSSNVQTINN
jgi:hypothetical protein